MHGIRTAYQADCREVAAVDGAVMMFVSARTVHRKARRAGERSGSSMNRHQPVSGKWSTARVTSLASTFEGATAFNQNLSRWATGSVTNMHATFAWASSFNQGLNSWGH